MTLRSAWRHIFGRREVHAEPQMREKVFTAANVLTFARAVASTSILVVAIVHGSYELLLVGLAFSMFLDFLDGQIARALKDETVFGAQLDGFADRITTALVAAGMVSMYGDPIVVISATAVWIQFGVVDQFLSNQFLRFNLWSPDHFYQLARPWGERIWRQNWSAIAKLASNLPIVLLALQVWWLALAASMTLVVLRFPGYLGIRTLLRDVSSPTPAATDSTLSPAPSPRIRSQHLEGQRGHKLFK